jgi:1-acyl-sn-glycerol-3-phosphate acyltransferase
MPLLTRTQVSGREHFPAQGPLIVVGNHIAAMEVVLMVVYAPWQMELLGPGDVPPPPMMNAIAKIHGYIPINRGNLDRSALTQALDILRQNGVLGMFPEGGIWEVGEKPPKRGVAWLSYMTQAPILPIGFGGVEGALTALMHLKRPRLTMNVGTLIPPVAVPPETPRKPALQAASVEVMERVKALIPEEDRMRHPEIRDEHFELRLSAYSAQGQSVPLDSAPEIPHSDALCKLLYRPALVNVFAKDIGLPISALQNLEDTRDPELLAQSIQPILNYLEHRNPGFLTYRYGHREGRAMEAGLRELQGFARWATRAAPTIHVRPIRRYRIAGRREEILERHPGEAHQW